MSGTLSENLGLLTAIIEEPDSDDLRLIYADWIDEHGEPERAEFIRVQCELADHGGCWEPEHRDALRRREREVYNNPFTSEEAVFGDCNVFAQRAWVFRRGFVAAVTCTLADWCGGECKRCEGTTLIYSPRFDDRRRTRGGRPVTECSICHGTGPALVCCCPLELVTLTDRRPYASTINNPYADCLVWFSSQPENAPSHLGKSVFQYLPGGYPRNKSVLEYQSLAVANAALSTACIAWAKATSQK